MLRFPKAACLAAMLLLAGCGDYAWNGTSYGSNPDVGSAPPPPVAAVPPGGQIYVVVPGDTVDSVAQQFGVTVQGLIDANHLAMPYALQGGQQLVIPGAAGSTGGLYTVQPGDTLTRISRQHATTIAELASLNGLQPPYPLKVGQQLRLPGSPAMATGTVASAPALVMPPSQPAPSLPASGNATMTTESLAPPLGVSAAPQPTPSAGTQVGTSTAPPSTAGAATTATSANAGTTTTSLPPPALTPVNTAGSPPAPLLAPPSTSQVSTQAAGNSAAANNSSGATTETTPVLPPPPANSSTVSPIGQATAALNSGSGQSAGETPAPRSAGKFLWPVNGKVISPFGPKDGGQHNDGINIAAPLGTPVRAAENGVVVYAGNELRGFGNLLLIRHADGWVSAYAHCDSLLVKRGASVNRGQVIARVGQSGNVTSPQLHFELRKGAQAVDPMTELAPQGA